MDSSEQEYNDFLDAFSLRSALEQELGLEDDYQQHVQQVLVMAGLHHLRSDYDLPLAFSGGGAAGQLLLRALAEQIRTLSGGLGLGSPSVFVGFWPAGKFGASTTKTDSGAYVRIDIGLWFYIRFACQQVANSLASITGNESFWGAESDKDLAGRVLHDHLDAYIRRGVGLRDNTSLIVMRGPREQFRRDLNLACLAFVVAHEYAHVISLAFPGTTSNSGLAWSEEAEMGSIQSEMEADLYACRILQQPPFSRNKLAAVMAPVLVLYVEAFSLRTRIEMGLTSMGWTHMFPELRAEAPMALIAPESQDKELHALGIQFKQWLWNVLHLQELFNQAGE